MATTATAVTIETMRAEVAQHDVTIEKLKSDIQESEAEANLLLVQERRATAADLPKILRRKEILESNLRRDRAALNDATNQSAALWKTIREAEEAERYRTRTEEPLKLRAEVLAAVEEYRATLAGMNPQATTITKALTRLRQIINSGQMGQFPIPAEIQAAQAALREIYDALRTLQLTFETSVGIK